MASQPVQMRQTDDDLRASPGWAFWAVVGVCLVLLGVQIAHYYPFMADDAFISLRYSQRLLEGKGLTWSGDQRTEGYTNLLWVLLCALLGALHIDLVAAARLLGIVCTLAAFAAVAAYVAVRFPPRQRALAAGCGLLPFALSAPFAVWAIGGLEQPLLIALLGWATFFALRRLPGGGMSHVWACGALLALVTITRADGFGFTLLFGFALLVCGGPFGAAWRVMLAPVLMLLAQLAFRHKYYRDWLPNTAYVKVSFTAHRLMTGLAYLRLGLSMELPLLLLAVVGIWMLWRRGERAAAFLLAFVPAAFLVYLALVGGDIFPAIRLMLPVLLLLCFAATDAAWLGFGERGRLRPAVAVALLVCGLATVTSRVGSVVATFELWEWQGKSLGLALRAGFGDKHPLLVADCAGAVPFFSQFEALDPLGLNDRHIARMPADMRGKGMMGHELGDGSYIIEHKPEIILFLTPAGDPLPVFNSDWQIYNDTRFSSAYQLVRLHVAGDRAAGGPAAENPDMVSALYIRRTDGRLGIEATPNRVTVPAYFAKPVGAAFVAASVPDGVLLVLPPGASATVEDVPLPPGRWWASTDDSLVEVSVVPKATSATTTTASVSVRNPTAKTVYARAIYLDRVAETGSPTSTPRSAGSAR
jgi:hypothetical protein